MKWYTDGFSLCGDIRQVIDAAENNALALVDGQMEYLEAYQDFTLKLLRVVCAELPEEAQVRIAAAFGFKETREPK